MKRVLLALMMVALLAMPAAASYQSVQVWKLSSTGAWVSPPSTDLGLHAKAFTSVPTGGICDKEDWYTEIVNHVTVSQWINYSFGGTRWDWQIRKPGTFAADCIQFSVTSNDDVEVTFDGFAALAPLVHDAAPINVWYGYGEPASDAVPPSTWYTPEQLNAATLTLPYADVSTGLTKKLWNKVEILNSTRACDYEDVAGINLHLTDVKYFIDPVTGDYNGAEPSANTAWPGYIPNQQK